MDIEGGINMEDNRPRDKLKAARNEKGFIQKVMADKLGITVRHYQRIERGETVGTIALWDKIEDLVGVPQRLLRD